MNEKFKNAVLTALVFLAWLCAIVFPISLIMTFLTCCGTVELDSDAEAFWLYSAIVSFSVFISSVATHIVLQAALLYIEKNKKEGK